MLLQLVAGFGEHAPVLRDDRTREFRGADMVHAIPQDEGYWVAAVLSGRCCFLGLGVGLRSGQICRRSACDIHAGTAADHLER